MSDEEDLLGKACDNPDVVRARGRYAPALEEPWGIDPTEGMCNGAYCNAADIDAWLESANDFMKRLARANELLKKKAISVYTELEEQIPEEIAETISRADTVLVYWNQAYPKYKDRSFMKEWGEIIGMAGVAYVHTKSKPIVSEIIGKFREAACIFDEVNETYEALGGKSITIPGAGQKPPPKSGALTKPIAAAALLGAAVFFGYKTTQKKRKPGGPSYG